ncbi:amidoligase family protein [Desulfotomaculum varum]
MKNQAFGIEIELTGITREKAAEVIAEYFGTSYRYEGGSYNKYTIPDRQGREWKVVKDSSIDAKYRTGRGMVPANSNYQVELVSPKCSYGDIDTIQVLVRKLRAAGAIANKSCGIHIHVDAANHNAKTLRNLVNIMASKEELIYKALEVDEARMARYCKKVDSRLVDDINRTKPKTMEALSDIWYKPYGGDGRYQHYHLSRYHGLNLHSVFSKGTVEFRLFNSTTHAGKIKAYIQFCLAVSHQAINQKSASARKTESDNEKYTFRTWLLRLGLIGDEFKTARLHLLAKLKGNTAWRHAA